MELVLELLRWCFGEIIFANTGYAIIYLVTFGQVKPSQVSEGTAVAVGVVFWLVVLIVGIVLVVRRR